MHASQSSLLQPDIHLLPKPSLAETLPESACDRARCLTDFLHEASMHLRTPLSVIKLSMYLCEKATDAVQQAHYLHIADAQADHLMRLFEQVISLAQLEQSEQLEVTWADLNALAYDVCTGLQARADDLQVQLVHQLDPGLPRTAANPALLDTALRSMARFALDHVPAGEMLWVLTYSDAESAIIELCGADLKVDTAERLFDRMHALSYAVDCPALLHDPLGLPVAWQILRLHGGQIEIEPTPEWGTVLRLVLPLTG